MKFPSLSKLASIAATAFTLYKANQQEVDAVVWAVKRVVKRRKTAG